MASKYFSNPSDSDLETIFSRFQVGIGPKALGRGEMISIILQNPLTNADGTNNTSELFFGSASNQIYFMVPGQESPLVYAEDLKDLYIKLNFPQPNPNGGILIAAAFAPGLGYTGGDVLTLTPDAYGSGTVATITVDTVDGSGVILTFTVTTPGTGFVVGTHYAATGGTGEGAIFAPTSVETVVPETADVSLLINRKRQGGKQ